MVGIKIGEMMLYLPFVVLLHTFLAAKINGLAFLRLLWTISLMHTCWQYTGIVEMWIITVHIWWRLLIAMFSKNTVLQMFPCTSVPLQKYCPLLHSHVWLLSTWHHTITLTFVGLLYIVYVYSISTLFCNSISG